MLAVLLSVIEVAGYHASLRIQKSISAAGAATEKDDES